MKTRIISGIVMLIVALTVFVYLPINFYLIAISLLGLVMLYEWDKLLKFNRSLFRIYFWLIYILIVIGPLWLNYTAIQQNYQGVIEDYYFSFVGAAIFWIITLVFTLFPIASARFNGVALIGLTVLIVSKGFLQALFVLRYYQDQNFTPIAGLVTDSGFTANVPYILLYVSILIWVTDSFAYFVGVKFGKHKLAKLVSPGKTIEGAIGGIAAAAIWAFITLYSGLGDKLSINNPLLFICLSMITVIFAIQGDLYESLLKRRAEIKDSSNLIPGHGGVLDRVDALMPAFVIFCLGYFYL